MAARSLALATLAGLLTARTWAATVQMDWVLPQNPDFSSSFHEDDNITLQWTQNLQDWFPSYCKPCDTSNVDLWVVGGTDDKYQYKIAASLDITTTLSQDWTVTIPDDALEKMQVWSLRFIPSGTAPHGSGNSAEISSPQFQIQAAVTTTTSGATTSTPTPSATTGSPEAVTTTNGAVTTTTSASSGSGGLSTGAQAGIGVGVGLAAVLVIAALAFWLIRRRRNAKNASVATPELPHAPLRDHQQPPSGDQSPPVGGYFQQDRKDSSQGSSPAPPYIPPLSEAASIPRQPKPAELHASVDPAELEGSAGTRYC